MSVSRNLGNACGGMDSKGVTPRAAENNTRDRARFIGRAALRRVTGFNALFVPLDMTLTAY